MDVSSALPVALLATACLPAVVAAVICADEVVERVSQAIDERYGAWRERRLIGRLNQLAEANGLGRDINLSQLDSDQPSIEEIADDLRRLRRLRLAAGTSRFHRELIGRAYDDRLRQACRCLGVAEHLDELDGLDLEIERVRVEGELEAAGLMLSPGGGAGE
ncbi:MAG TPA: hypothetical protein VF174_08355 [Micromonosporaceae bacterium]